MDEQLNKLVQLLDQYWANEDNYNAYSDDGVMILEPKGEGTELHHQIVDLVSRVLLKGQYWVLDSIDYLENYEYRCWSKKDDDGIFRAFLSKDGDTITIN